MSTILDALRKVERERDPSADSALDAPTVSSQVRRRRNFPLGAILACAVLGFGGGAVLSWWLPSEPAQKVATLPAPPPPPDITVPRAPLRAKPAALAAPAADEVAAVSPPVAVPPRVAVAPPAGVPPAAAPTAVGDPAPAAVVQKRVEPSVPAPAAVRPESGPVVAVVDPKASALEPSPFGSAREASAPAPTEPAKGAIAEAPNAPSRTEAREPQDLAAIAPQEPAAPDTPAADEVESEPEPETPAEVVVDTGRSPPGAPKVALSFLQWSAEPERRFAFVSIDGAPSQRVHEGEVAAGLTVAAITPTGVRFKREGTVFVIRPRH